MRTPPTAGHSSCSPAAGWTPTTRCSPTSASTLGISSGVAWSGAPVSTTQPLPVNAEGDVRSSMFLHNYFGAYTRRAQGMQWVGNTFADNEEYGFDPHDFSNDFLVQGNVAYGNGKHGFIFSRGCVHNTLRDNISHDNGGHGFMIDDGRSRPSTAAMARINGSSGNVLTNNTSFNNAGNGVEIEGGTANVVTDNRVSGNYVGIQVKDDAAVTVRDNTHLRQCLVRHRRAQHRRRGRCGRQHDHRKLGCGQPGDGRQCGGRCEYLVRCLGAAGGGGRGDPGYQLDRQRRSPGSNSVRCCCSGPFCSGCRSW